MSDAPTPDDDRDDDHADLPGLDADDLDRIHDPDDDTGHERRKRILNMRADLLDERRELLRREHLDGLPHFDVMTAYRDAVESWLIEVEPLYLEFAPDVWQEEVIGTTTFHPPDGPTTSSLRGGGSWDAPDPVTVQFTLADLLNTPNPIQYQFEFTKTDRHPDAGLYETDTEVVADTYQLTQQTLDAAVRRTGEFLREIGFGVEVSEDTDTLNV